MVGNDSSSKIYVKNKSKACEELGIKYEEFLLEADISQEQLLNLIKKLNESVLKKRKNNIFQKCKRFIKT